MPWKHENAGSNPAIPTRTAVGYRLSAKGSKRKPMADRRKLIAGGKAPAGPHKASLSGSIPGPATAAGRVLS